MLMLSVLQCQQWPMIGMQFAPRPMVLPESERETVTFYAEFMQTQFSELFFLSCNPQCYRNIFSAKNPVLFYRFNFLYRINVFTGFGFYRFNS